MKRVLMTLIPFNTTFQKCLVEIKVFNEINHCLCFLFMQVIYMGVGVYTPALALNAGKLL